MSELENDCLSLLDKEGLTRYYFWQQKFHEIMVFFGILFLIFVIPYGLGIIARYIEFDYSFCKFVTVDEEVFESCISSGFGGTWSIGGIFAVLTLAIMFCLVMIRLIIADWIKSNWERAEERADEYEKSLSVANKAINKSKRRSKYK